MAVFDNFLQKYRFLRNFVKFTGCTPASMARVIGPIFPHGALIKACPAKPAPGFRDRHPKT